MCTLTYIHNRYDYGDEESLANLVGFLLRSHPKYGLQYSYSVSYDLFFDILVEQMENVQRTFRRIIGRRAIHAVLAFNEYQSSVLKSHSNVLSSFCLMCGSYYHSKGLQSFSSVYTNDSGLIEIHFCVNPVSFIDGKKYITHNGQAAIDEGWFNWFLSSYLYYL